METIEKTIERICRELPGGYQIGMIMEEGAAFVELIDGDGIFRKLPDDTDKSLAEQLQDALSVALGLHEAEE